LSDLSPTTQSGRSPEPRGNGSSDGIGGGGRSFSELFGRITANVSRVIQGKAEVIELAVVCLIAEGHLLIEDVPGVGKTSLAKALAGSLDCSFGRIQFTPDVLPSDVAGVNVWNRSTSSFQFQPGPVFANIVLGDEINRASPKTQAALLEAMAERQVTIDGTSYGLGVPFMVIATQNPIEHEGTYPLPESQLDRFLMRVSVGYPAREAALEILRTHGDDPAGGPPVEAVVGTEEVVSMIRAARRVHIAPSLQNYIIELAEASRDHPALSLGISPRATLNLQGVSRVLAASKGRNFVIPDDIKTLAVPVLAHRLVLTPDAQLQGVGVGSVIDDILARTAVPATADG